MKKAVIFSALFFLIGLVPAIAIKAFASDQGIIILAQNEYGQEGEGYGQDLPEELEQEVYPEEGEYDQEQQELYPPSFPEGEGDDQPEELEPPLYPEGEEQYPDEQPELPPLPEGEGENDQEQQYPNEPGPYQDPEGLIDQEQLEKDEPSPEKDLDAELQGDLPAPGGLMDDAALSAGGSASALVSGQCDKAAGKVLFLLDNVGIHPGTTYIKSQGMAAFSNSGPVTHPVAISPSGFFDSNSFRVIPGTKVYTKASSTTQSRHGRIVVNQGKSNETVHDVVICP